MHNRNIITIQLIWEKGGQTTTIKTIRFIENAGINIYDALDGFFLLKYPLLMTGFWQIIVCRRAY